MTKKRAYTSPTGKETISAQQVKEYRARYNNQPYPYPLYSTDKPGLRRRVYHSRKGSGYFAFNPDGSAGSAASGGESLNHLLFKEAISGLKRTRLALYKPGNNERPDRWIDAPITICPTVEREKMISPGDGLHPLFADIYLKFKSDHWIAEKWSGEAYVEIFNTHAVEVEKQKVLKRLELPTIEVDIREQPYAYAVDDDDTTDELEAAHVRRLRRMLEHDNGFLKAIVLSNPSSAPYLRTRLTQQIEQTKQI
jgi:hypothetical protein